MYFVQYCYLWQEGLCHTTSFLMAKIDAAQFFSKACEPTDILIISLRVLDTTYAGKQWDMYNMKILIFISLVTTEIDHIFVFMSSQFYVFHFFYCFFTIFLLFCRCSLYSVSVSFSFSHLLYWLISKSANDFFNKHKLPILMWPNLDTFPLHLAFLGAFLKKSFLYSVITEIIIYVSFQKHYLFTFHI